eukprot:m.7031 g.7031  ORF g.7031 m.7031 type:complete len:81 (+) comp17529_c0_seq1:80-322(+)
MKFTLFVYFVLLSAAVFASDTYGCNDLDFCKFFASMPERERAIDCKVDYIRKQCPKSCHLCDLSSSRVRSSLLYEFESSS